MSRLKRVLNEMAHSINDPLPHEGKIVTVIAALWLIVAAKHGWL